jgi:hypothetical protein
MTGRSSTGAGSSLRPLNSSPDAHNIKTFFSTAVDVLADSLPLRKSPFLRPVVENP